MKKQKIIFYKGMLLLFVWAVSLCSFAQNITLRGNVSDTKGDPLVVRPKG